MLDRSAFQERTTMCCVKMASKLYIYPPAVVDFLRKRGAMFFEKGSIVTYHFSSSPPEKPLLGTGGLC